MSKKIVLEIKPKDPLTDDERERSKDALVEAFNYGDFSYFFDYGKSKGNVRVKGYLSPDKVIVLKISPRARLTEEQLRRSMNDLIYSFKNDDLSYFFDFHYGEASCKADIGGYIE